MPQFSIKLLLWITFLAGLNFALLSRWVDPSDPRELVQWFPRLLLIALVELVAASATVWLHRRLSRRTDIENPQIVYAWLATTIVGAWCGLLIGIPVSIYYWRSFASALLITPIVFGFCAATGFMLTGLLAALLAPLSWLLTTLLPIRVQGRLSALLLGALTATIFVALMSYFQGLKIQNIDALVWIILGSITCLICYCFGKLADDIAANQSDKSGKSSGR